MKKHCSLHVLISWKMQETQKIKMILRTLVLSIIVITDARETVRRVMFGTPLQKWTFPYTSQVVLRNKFSNGSTLTVCGGVFIHKAVVLTAASCLTKDVANTDNLQFRYAGVTYDTLKNWRGVWNYEKHPNYDAALVRLKHYATEGISYFDRRFWSHRAYDRTCGTFICGWGKTNKTENHRVKFWDSGRMNVRHNLTFFLCKFLENSLVL